MFGSSLDSSLLLDSIYQTLYMVTVSLVLGALIGIPLGILLVITRKMVYGKMSLFIIYSTQLLIFSDHYLLLFY